MKTNALKFMVILLIASMVVCTLSITMVSRAVTYEEITMEMLNNILLDCVERLGVQYNPDNLGTMTDAEVLEQQKIDMENLEKLAQKREEELKKE